MGRQATKTEGAPPRQGRALRLEPAILYQRSLTVFPLL